MPLRPSGCLLIANDPIRGATQALWVLVIANDPRVTCGLLVPFVQRSLDRGTLPAFHAMNAALKDRAERATASRG